MRDVKVVIHGPVLLLFLDDVAQVELFLLVLELALERGTDSFLPLKVGLFIALLLLLDYDPPLIDLYLLRGMHVPCPPLGVVSVHVHHAERVLMRVAHQGA